MPRLEDEEPHQVLPKNGTIVPSESEIHSSTQSVAVSSPPDPSLASICKTSAELSTSSLWLKSPSSVHTRLLEIQALVHDSPTADANQAPPVGAFVGVAVGANTGLRVGNADVGEAVGEADGSRVGDTDGPTVGVAVGAEDGVRVGDTDGPNVGAKVGFGVQATTK